MTCLPPGGLADVWFQLCLGEVLRQERPPRFEQDAAPAAFVALDGSPSPPTCAWAFARAARASPSFGATLYAGALRRELAREPARLVGAPALALSSLGPSGASFEFGVEDPAAETSIRAAAAALAPGAAVRCWGPGAEPDTRTDVDARGSRAALRILEPLVPASGLSPAQTVPFLTLARRGCRVLQVVAYGAPLAPVSEVLRAELGAAFHALAAELPAAAFWCGELRPADPDPHAPGVALLAANLSPASSATCRELAIRLAHALASDAEGRERHGTLVYRET